VIPAWEKPEFFAVVQRDIQFILSTNLRSSAFRKTGTTGPLPMKPDVMVLLMDNVSCWPSHLLTSQTSADR
jgi:hypothetical protein